MGVVQDLGYVATFPLLLNIADQPTYFIPLKDATDLVKSYAMVNVAQYQIVATGNTVSACEQAYIKMLNEKGLTQQEQLPINQVQGKVAELRSAVLEGNTYYFIRLEGSDLFYSISAAQSREAVTLNAGDQVALDYTPAEDATILDSYGLTILGRNAAKEQLQPTVSDGEEAAVPNA